MTDETRQSPTNTVSHATDGAAVARVAELFEKMKSSPIGMSEPWESKPSNGKPLLYGGRRGLLAYGTIATWAEFDLIVAVINALPALLASPVEIEPDIWSAIAGSVREQISDGDGFWRSCSGCFETEDGQNVHGYPHSKVFGCVLGSGCRECGGIGAVWDTTDYGAMAKAIMVADAPWRVVPHPKLKRDFVGRTVRTKRDMRNGMATIPKGTIATIKGRSRVGAELTSAKCECCGLHANISRIGDHDFEFVEQLSNSHRPETSAR